MMKILPYDGTMRTTPKKAHEGQARAKFNFVAQTNLELSLVKGKNLTLKPQNCFFRLLQC